MLRLVVLWRPSRSLDFDLIQDDVIVCTMSIHTMHCLVQKYVIIINITEIKDSCISFIKQSLLFSGRLFLLVRIKVSDN